MRNPTKSTAGKGLGRLDAGVPPRFQRGRKRHGRLHQLEKDFVGKAATEAARDERVARKLVTMTIDVDGIDVSGDEAILKNGEAVGYISSGGYGHRMGGSMAMGYVAASNAEPGTVLDVEILGQVYSAEGHCQLAVVYGGV